MRAPTSSARSPPGQPSVHRSQPGRSRWISAVVGVEPGEPRRVARPAQRTGEHEVERHPGELARERVAGDRLPGGRERDVGAAGVPARERPLGLAMARQPERRLHARSFPYDRALAENHG